MTVITLTARWFPWVVTALILWCGLAPVRGHAQSAASQACEESRLAVMAPNPVCFYREETGQSVGKDGMANCVIRTSAVRLNQPNAGSVNYFYRLREASPSPKCYMKSAEPQSEIDTVKGIDPVTKNGGNWSTARVVNGTSVATFVNMAGKNCVAFQKHGPAMGPGLTWLINGFYCEAPSADPGPIPDARIARYLDMAKPRN